MKRVLIAGVAGLAIVAAGISLWRTLHPISDKFDPTSSRAVGQVLAEETATAIQDKGRVIPVISEEHRQNVGAAHSVWKAFQDELKKHPGIELASPEIPINSEGLPGCSAANFREILERHSQAGAIVFFVPVPSWLHLKGPIPAPPAARIIFLGLPLLSAKNEFTGYFEHKLLSLLLCWRMTGGSDRIANPRTPRERFQNEYQIFTPENYQTLPD